MPTTLFKAKFAGLPGTDLSTIAPLVGTWGTFIDFLANGGAIEVDGGGQARPRGVAATFVYGPMTGYTPPTGDRTIAMNVQAGDQTGQNNVSVTMDTNAGNDSYVMGLSNNGIFIDKYLAGVFSSNLGTYNTGIVAGTNYNLQFDCYATKNFKVYSNGVKVLDVTDGTPIAGAIAQEYFIVNNQGPVTANVPRCGRLEFFDALVPIVIPTYNAFKVGSGNGFTLNPSGIGRNAQLSGR